MSATPGSNRLQRLGIGLCIAMCAWTAGAQTQAGGAITANTVWSAAQSPYVVSSDIQVQGGAMLTIEAGTTVYMGAGTSFIVQSGTVKAIGTTQAPILITSQKKQSGQTPAPADWQQLVLNAGTTNTTQLENVQIEYGKGVLINGASPTLNHVTISNHQGAAITADLAASPVGGGNLATGNDINAIVVPGGDISGTVTWGLRGIPYLVSSGVVSVGASPKINALTPGSLQQGETQTVTITGSRLAGLTQPTFTLNGLSAQVLAGGTDTQAQLQISSAATTVPGSSGLSALVDAGEVTFSNAVTVVSIQPQLVSVDPSVISTSQGDVSVTLKGVSFTNQSVAYLDATALVTTYVSSTEVRAVIPHQATSGSKSIKLRTPNTTAGGSEFVSNVLTIIVMDNFIQDMAPKLFETGSGPTPLTITGIGLQGATSVAVVPADGVTIGAKVIAADGRSITVPLMIAANAPATERQVVVLSPAGIPYQVIKLNGDRILVTPPMPATLDSTDPIALQIGATPVVMTLRGKNFQNALSVTFVPPEGITVSAPVVDVSGTRLTVNVSASATAVAGPRAVVITTPIGQSSSAMTTVNTVTLGSTLSTSGPVMSPLLGIVLPVPVEQQQTLPQGPIAAPLLGVVLQSPAQQQQTVTWGPVAAPLLGVILQIPAQQQQTTTLGPITAANVGLIVGSAGTNVQPKNFIVGSSGTLTISGSGLGATSAISIYPEQGVTIGAPLQVAADGTQVTVPISIAADAAPALRTVVITSPNGNTAFADPANSIISISPNSTP